MTDEPKIIHAARKDRDGPDISACPDHPNTEPEVSFGLAGGGYGAYTYCPECFRVLTKTLEHDA